MQTLYINKLGRLRLSQKKDQFVIGLWLSASLRWSAVILGIYLLTTTGLAVSLVAKIGLVLALYCFGWMGENFCRMGVRHTFSPPVIPSRHMFTDLCEHSV